MRAADGPHQTIAAARRSTSSTVPVISGPIARSHSTASLAVTDGAPLSPIVALMVDLSGGLLAVSVISHREPQRLPAVAKARTSQKMGQSTRAVGTAGAELYHSSG